MCCAVLSLGGARSSTAPQGDKSHYMNTVQTAQSLLQEQGTTEPGYTHTELPSPHAHMASLPLHTTIEKHMLPLTGGKRGGLYHVPKTQSQYGLELSCEHKSGSKANFLQCAQTFNFKGTHQNIKFECPNIMT